MDTSEAAEEDHIMMQDPEFQESALETLLSVDPNHEATQNAMGSLTSQANKDGMGVGCETPQNVPSCHTDYLS